VSHNRGADVSEEVEMRGRTSISDEVISIIARKAADKVEGVHQIADPNLSGMIRRLGRHAGVASEVGSDEAAIDVSIVVNYGMPIREVAAALRGEIIQAVETMTGMKVVEVNVDVHDVHVPKIEQRSRRQLE
jgi:uncharacterized alkaline shock family protein YloU